MSRIRAIAVILALASALAVPQAGAQTAPLPNLKVSADGHYLVKEDGTPFFWLGDTAWGLFNHPTPTDAAFYLKNRADKGFTVIQVTVLSWDSFNHPDSKGYFPFINRDPTKPDERFFQDADAVIDQAQADGLYVAIVPLWSKTYLNQTRKVLNPASAEIYGKDLGHRWRDKPVIWILGGDTPGTGLLDICRSLAAGLKEGDGGTHLITYHPTGGLNGESSSWWFAKEPWLSFNGLQTGHFIQNHNYNLIAHDYALTPPKPVIDLESGYENITDRLVPWSTPGVKRISAWDVRRYAHLAIFAGAAGYTYGNGEVYGFSATTRPAARWGSGLTWRQSIDLPASGQMQFLRRLIESRPMLVRIPDQSMLIGDTGQTTQRIEATRASDGSYAFIYTAAGKPIHLKPDSLAGSELTTWWYNPRDGTAQRIGEMAKYDAQVFTPPTNGVGNDWVLTLDETDKNFPPPGTRGN
jgi:hypothetical protein